jgi:hypothetical protein
VILNFGKYKDWDLTEVPDEYVDYMVQQKRRDLQLWEGEQHRRELMHEAELPMIEKLVKAGYHALAHKYHPDRGGDEDAMRQLNAAMAQLQEIVSTSSDGVYP